MEQLVRLETSVLLAEQVSRERFAAREREVLIRDSMEEVLICSTHTHTHTHTCIGGVGSGVGRADTGEGNASGGGECCVTFFETLTKPI